MYILILFSSISYSLYFGFDIINDSEINPWTLEPYTVGEIFISSLLMIHTSISLI